MNFGEYSVVAACRCFSYDHVIALAKGFLVSFFFLLVRQEEHLKIPGTLVRCKMNVKSVSRNPFSLHPLWMCLLEGNFCAQGIVISGSNC